MFTPNASDDYEAKPSLVQGHVRMTLTERKSILEISREIIVYHLVRNIYLTLTRLTGVARVLYQN